VENIFSGLSLIIALGAGMALIMKKIGQPLIIGHILTGILVGPAVLGVLDSPKQLTVFGDIGIALLLFIIGLGMNPREIKEVGKPSVYTAAAEIGVTSIVAWFALVALGLGKTEALLVGIGLGINSTIVALKLLGDRRELGRLWGKLTIGTSLAEDVIAAVLLLVLASAHDGQWLSAGPFMTLAFKGILVGGLLYVFTSYVLPRLQKLIASEQELLFLFAIAWGLGWGALFAKVGFSMEIGALAAGVSLAAFPYAREVAARLRPLRDFFVIVFFISLGTELTFDNFGALILPLVFSVLIVTLIKPMAVMTTLGLFGYTKRTSFKTAVTLTQVSEFSIIFLVLAAEKNLVPQTAVVLLTFTALITIAVSTYLVTWGDKIYARIEGRLNLFEWRKTREEVHVTPRYELILFGYQKGGHEFVNTFKQLNKKFVVVDYDPEVIDMLEHRGIDYLYGDATDIELLEEAGVDRAKLIVSTITDFETNSILLDYIERKNPQAVFIGEAENPRKAAKLYHQGASYVILPHFIGSEKISGLVKKSGISRATFKKYREEHLKTLEEEFGALDEEAEHDRKIGKAIVKGLASLTSKN
jgi:Kef-type K+ transport system membrane component KefB/voltage-gated potassium channel Kch